MRPSLNSISSKITAIILFLLITNRVLAQVPVAQFSGAPLSGCSPLVVNFQDLSTGGPTSWNWNFGNGNTSTLQTPTATYFTPGTYTVSLTVTNVNGSHTLVRNQYITVYEPPVVNFSANILSGCFPLRVQFTDLSTAGSGNTNVSWDWDFGNGVISNQQNPQVTYNAAGNYSVTLKVTNDKGCVKTVSRPNYITVTPGVDASFSNSSANVCAPPASITFTNTSTGPPVLSYFWDFGDGNTSTLQNPVHPYATSGTFTAMLVTSSTAGCVDTAYSNPIVIGGIVTDFTAPASICLNDTASFINNSTPAPISSSWTFGDGGTATTINTSHAYNATGVYTVWLYNTYSTCIDSISHTITVNPLPVADFTAPVTSKCEPSLTVNFQDLSTGGVAGWQWDFGDGNTSTLQNPTHTYTAYGAYTVTLIITSTSGCVDTVTKVDFIDIRRAQILMTGLPVRGCIPYTINPVPIINAVDAVTSYQWDFGDGGTSTLPLPTHTYTVLGTYNVRLIITTSSGCTDTLFLPQAVRVGTKPVANFTAAPIPVCGGQPVYFTDLSVPADEWNWDFGDGGIAFDQNPAYVYTDTGFFTVTLIAFNSGCPDTMIRTNYTQTLPPIARFQPTADCSNRLRFSFTDLSIAPQSWQWNFGDGSPLVTTQNPSHIFPALGTYNVTLIVTNGGCADTVMRTIVLLSESPDFTSDIAVACKEAAITFQATNLNAINIVAYNWTFGDGGTGTGMNPTYNYTVSGTYNVTLSVMDINGCVDMITKPNFIRINGPLANFNATNNTGCAGLTVTFNDLSSNDGQNNIVNWQWDFGDGNVQNFSGPPFTHTYTSVGTYSVNLHITDAAGCVDSVRIDSVVRTSIINPEFAGFITQTCPGNNVVFYNYTTPPGFSSFWDFGDGNTSTATTPIHAYAATGLYTVQLIVQDANGCRDTITKTDYMTVDLPRAGYTVADSISSCTPFEVQFTNTSTYFSSVLWDFGPGEGVSTLTNPVHYFSTPGVYPVKLVITSPGGCLDSIVKNIYVNDTAGSRVNYLPLGGCKPLAASFNTFTPGQMVSYFWDFGDGYTQTTTTPNVNHVYSSYGNFLPKVIMEDPSGCQIPLQGLDTVYVTGANARFGADSSLFCDIGTVNFIDSTTFNDPVISYNWSFGDGGTSTLQNPSHNYTAPGLYSVQLIVQTQLGCSDTLLKPQLIRIVQRPLIDITGDTVVCINSSLLHTGIFLQPDTSVVTWQWNFPNGNTSAQQNPPQQVYTTAGSFVVTSVATNSTGCKDTTRQTIIVHPLPSVTLPGQITVQAGFPVTIPATYSPNTVSWIWSPSTGLSCGNCATPDAGPRFNTTYQVYFTDNNGCSNLGSVEVIVICKDANLFVPNTFSPNGDGSNDVFYPRGRGLDRVKFMRVFNRWGEVVFERREFQVNDVAAGWNGMYKGQKPKADVYVYQIEVFCENGEIIRLNGNIALVL